MSTVSRLVLLPVLLAAVVHADPAPTSAWTLRTSVAGRVGYDDNVFLQDRSDVLPGVVGAVPDRAGSWFGRASVALDATWQASPALRLDLSYSPELVRYEAFSSENHDDHHLDLGLNGHSGAWSYQLKTGLLLIDGEQDSPIYGHTGGGPAIGGVGVRSRRDQLTSKLGGQLTRTYKAGFVRAVGDLCATDFETRQVDTAITPGYSNYVDRSEWSAGVETGLYVHKDFAVVTGVRRGEQRQSNLLGVPLNYSNSFTRFLVGVEGQPRNDLTLRLLGGPDVRRYGDDVAAGFDRNQTARYIEASATWTPRAADAVTLTGKDYLFLSAGGRCAYQHTTANLRWQHTFTPDWSVAFGSEVQAGDSRAYQPAATERLDWIYSETLTVTRSLGAKTKLDFEITREWSDSAIADKPGREYTRWVASVGVRRAF